MVVCFVDIDEIVDHNCFKLSFHDVVIYRSRGGCDHMVVGFTTTCAIVVYHQ